MRPLFVFAGQSNMMGASVLPATEQIYYKDSAEYLHKPKRFGYSTGTFKKTGFPSGEFSYKDLHKAYGHLVDVEKKSKLGNYTLNTYFCPSMCNLKSVEEKKTYPFDYFCEANALKGVCVAPYIVKGLEETGYKCAYTHIAKGSVGIDYYIQGDAANYFEQKVCDFFMDCEKYFIDDDISEKILVWNQGENDGANGYEYYIESLDKLWTKAKRLGFTRFFIIRVGFWGDERIIDVMRAQEDFCREHQDVYMLTRVASYFEFIEQKEDWFTKCMPEEFSYCRDSFYGYLNHHINEKGFKVISKYAVPNIVKILFEGKEPILEDELIKYMVQ